MQMPSAPLPNLTLLFDRYRILSLLGQGGMSRVYLAQDLRLNLRVAVKENLQSDPQARTQFLTEAQLLAALSHPNLPRVIDYFDDPATRRQYLVMDYIEGDDLHALIKRTGPLPEAAALAWTRQVLSALEYLHSQQPPVIHRDIKPSNIKITPQGKAVLVDFGIAKVFDARGATVTGARAATPGYAPPEQYGMRTDERSDIYSLGATLYTMLTGRVPPEAPLRMAETEKLIPPGQLAPNLSANTEAVLQRALEISSSKRFQTVVELRAALERRADRPVAVEPEPAAAFSIPALSAQLASVPDMIRARRPLALVGVVATLAILCLALSGGLLFIRSLLPAPQQIFVSLSWTSTPGPAGTVQPKTAPAARLSTATIARATTPPTYTPRPLTTVPQSASRPAGAPDCPVAVASAFNLLWARFNKQLGCPQADAVSPESAEEKFQSGRMLRRADLKRIYVVYDDGTWQGFPDSYAEGEPQYFCGAKITPPSPVRSFSKLWCGNANVKARLGNATEPETEYCTKESPECEQFQDFKGGMVYYSFRFGAAYALLADGTWVK